MYDGLKPLGSAKSEYFYHGCFREWMFLNGALLVQQQLSPSMRHPMILQLGGCDARRDTILGCSGGFLLLQLSIACLGLAPTALEFFSRLSLAMGNQYLVVSTVPPRVACRPRIHLKTDSGVCSKILLCFVVFVRRRQLRGVKETCTIHV